MIFRDPCLTLLWKSFQEVTTLRFNRSFHCYRIITVLVTSEWNPYWWWYKEDWFYAHIAYACLHWCCICICIIQILTVIALSYSMATLRIDWSHTGYSNLRLLNGIYYMTVHIYICHKNYICVYLQSYKSQQSQVLWDIPQYIPWNMNMALLLQYIP